jgi:energy-coupling factor transport system permease protein
VSAVRIGTATLATPAATSRGIAAAPARRRARWARGRPRYGLARLHPLAALACIGALLAAGFILANPLQLAALLVMEMAALAFSRRLSEAKPYLRLSLYIAAFLVCINPLFSRGGLDVLWHAHLGFFDLTITVQGVLFGLGSALRLCVVVWAFALYNVVLDADDQLAIMSSVSFRSGLVVSLATRLFPVLSRDAARISDAQRARGVELDRGRRRDRVAARLPLLGALLTQSLERATDVAESMEARGYGRRGRRAWKRGRRWHVADLLTAAAALGAAAALLTGLVLGAFRFRFFPLLDDPWSALLDPMWLIAAGALVLTCIVVPLLVEPRWRR